MQALERILQEIEKESYSTNTDYGHSVVVNMDSVAKTIRSHMEDEGPAQDSEYVCFEDDAGVRILRLSREDKQDGIIRSCVKGDGWIPVDERLPEEGDSVLVWYEYFRYGDYNQMFQTYGIGYQFDGHWSGDVSGENARCIAWQPLPAPYQPKEEKSDGNSM